MFVSIRQPLGVTTSFMAMVMPVKIGRS
jgi:hypothetical protein